MVYLAWRPNIRGLFRLIGWTAAPAAPRSSCSRSPRLWLALPAMYFVGMGMMVTAASTNTVLQTIVPDELRGRVASLYIVSFLGMSPLGALPGGWIAEHIGPPHSMALCGLLSLGAAALYLMQMPAIRRDILPVYRKLGIAPEADSVNPASAGTSPRQRARHQQEQRDRPQLARHIVRRRCP